MSDDGRGSYPRYGAKTAVEDCVDLDVRRLKKLGVLDERPSGILTWNWSNGEVRMRAAYELHGALLWLRYTWQGVPVESVTGITYTEVPHGGARPWIICPLIVKGVPCGRRVARLFLAGPYFGCRHCYQLVYRRPQTNRAIRRAIGPISLRRGGGL